MTRACFVIQNRIGIRNGGVDIPVCPSAAGTFLSLPYYLGHNPALDYHHLTVIS